MDDLPPVENEAEDNPEEAIEEPVWEPATSEDVLRYLKDNLATLFYDPESGLKDSVLAPHSLTFVNNDGVANHQFKWRAAMAESHWDGKQCVVVESEVQGIVSDLNWSATLTATVDPRNLGTIRQKRVVKLEASIEAGDVLERIQVIEMMKRPVTPVEAPVAEGGEGEDAPSPDDAGEGSGEDAEAPPEPPMHITYRVFHALKHGEDKEESEAHLDEDASFKFLSDGAQILLLRCLAKMDFQNLAVPLEFLAFDLDWNLCPLTITRLEDGSPDIICFVTTTHHPGGLKTEHLNGFLPSGKSCFSKLHDLDITFKLLSDDEPTLKGRDSEQSSDSVGTDASQKPVFPKQDLDIDEDLEMFSKYQDRKDELRASHASYVRHHPDLKTILSDFMQEVLTIQPDHFLSFASNYFSAFRNAETAANRQARSRSQSRQSSKRSSATNVPSECGCEDPDPVDAWMLEPPPPAVPRPFGAVDTAKRTNKLHQETIYTESFKKDFENFYS